jgi:hypothetical protein
MSAAVKLRTWLLGALALIGAGLPLSPIFADVPPPVPGLPDAERRTSYSITASTCACAVNMALYGDSTDFQNWVEVFINGVRVNYNDPTFGWTITSPTGPLATIPRPITDAVLTFTSAKTGTIQIVGARRPRRISQFSENRGVAARDLNQTVTDITAVLREMWDKTNDMTGRGLFFAPGNTVGPMPPPTACQNAYLAFDATGLNPNCVVSANPPTGITAGSGIAFTGTSPVSISNNIAAGNGVAITGTNPKTITNNIAAAGDVRITGTNPLTISTAGGWKISNLSAANDVSNISTQMDLNADWVTLYNPSAGTLITKGPAAGGGQVVSNLACNISSAGPVAGGRDQSAAFVATNTVWFYLISSSSGSSINCISSLTAPTALNSGGTTGPVLPGGYTSYAPAFPIKLVGSATLEPLAPQGGSLTYVVVGNTVTFNGPPDLCFTPCGFPSGAAQVSNWIPSAALNIWYYIDIEAGTPTTLVGGALVFNGTITNNKGGYNASLYVAGTAFPAVNNAILGPWPFPPTGVITYLFCSSAGALGACASGSINSQADIISPWAYTFPQ